MTNKTYLKVCIARLSAPRPLLWVTVFRHLPTNYSVVMDVLAKFSKIFVEETSVLLVFENLGPGAWCWTPCSLR